MSDEQTRSDASTGLYAQAGDIAPLVVPPDLVAEIRAMADEEQRPVEDVLRDVIECGLQDRRWRRMLAAAQERAKVLGLTEADVPRLIAECREEQRR